jgi:hypothetical protein
MGQRTGTARIGAAPTASSSLKMRTMIMCFTIMSLTCTVVIYATVAPWLESKIRCWVESECRKKVEVRPATYRPAGILFTNRTMYVSQSALVSLLISFDCKCSTMLSLRCTSIPAATNVSALPAATIPSNTPPCLATRHHVGNLGRIHAQHAPTPWRQKWPSSP